MPFVATWMEIIILSEVSQRKTNITWYHLYAIPKKQNDTREPIYKQKQPFYNFILLIQYLEPQWLA